MLQMYSSVYSLGTVLCQDKVAPAHMYRSYVIQAWPFKRLKTPNPEEDWMKMEVPAVERTIDIAALDGTTLLWRSGIMCKYAMHSCKL